MKVPEQTPEEKEALDKLEDKFKFNDYERGLIRGAFWAGSCANTRAGKTIDDMCEEYTDRLESRFSKG